MNTLADSLFHKICYLALARSTTQESHDRLVIVAESRAVLKTIYAQDEVRTRCVLISRIDHWYVLCRWIRDLLPTWFRYLATELKNLKDVRSTWNEGERKRPKESGPTALIHTWVDEDCFLPDGNFFDRYFTVLAAELTKRGYVVVTIPHLYNIHRTRLSALAFFRKEPGRYLIPEDFYSVLDYFWSVCLVISQAWMLRGDHAFLSQPVTELVREACRQQSLNGGAATFVRYVRFIRALEGSGHQFDLFIYTFENMVPEKPIIMAFRRHMPKTLLVGYQHYLAPPPLALVLIPDAEFSDSAPLPDIIVSSSPFCARVSAEEGLPLHKVRIGPSLRHLYLQGLSHEASPCGHEVLVLLSLEFNASCELMDRLLKAFWDDEGMVFRIKLHPMMPDSTWHDLLRARSLPEHMSRCRGSLDQWLAKAACVVVIASTTALETALAGKPTIVVSRETDFDINPLEWFPEMPPPVRSADDLRTRVLSILQQADSESTWFTEWASRKRQECLSPVSDETIEAFFRPLDPDLGG